MSLQRICIHPTNERVGVIVPCGAELDRKVDKLPKKDWNAFEGMFGYDGCELMDPVRKHVELSADDYIALVLKAAKEEA